MAMFVLVVLISRQSLSWVCRTVELWSGPRCLLGLLTTLPISVSRYLHVHTELAAHTQGLYFKHIDTHTHTYNISQTRTQKMSLSALWLCKPERKVIRGPNRCMLPFLALKTYSSDVHCSTRAHTHALSPLTDTWKRTQRREASPGLREL